MANVLKANPQFSNMAFENQLGELWMKNGMSGKQPSEQADPAATFSVPGTCMENVENLLRFATCNYIQEHHKIILLTTCSGKIYLACALVWLL